MTISQKNLNVTLIGTLLLFASSGLDGVARPAEAESPLSHAEGAPDPSAPLPLTPMQRTAILNAVRQDSAKPSTNMPPDLPVSVGVQLPASIALKILPDAALAQVPAAKTVQYTVIKNQVVLVDPTNMRVVDIIGQ